MGLNGHFGFASVTEIKIRGWLWARAETGVCVFSITCHLALKADCLDILPHLTSCSRTDFYSFDEDLTELAWGTSILLVHSFNLWFLEPQMGDGKLWLSAEDSSVRLNVSLWVDSQALNVSSLFLCFFCSCVVVFFSLSLQWGGDEGL